MKKRFGTLAALCLLFAGFSFATPSTATAQDQPSATTPPPKVLFIGVEFPKEGLAPDTLTTTENQYVQAYANAKFPEHDLAMNAISGNSKAVFFFGYDSFAAAQKVHEEMTNNPTLMAALHSADANESQMLKSSYVSAFVYRPGLSLHAPVDIEQMRFMEITTCDIHPGHRHEFETLAKMYNDAWSKNPNAHWATFEKWYGTNSGGRYIVITPMKSLAEADREMTDGDQFDASISATDRKKMADLEASSIASSETNLFYLNPKMSYVPDSWKAASPDFWGKQ